MSSKVLPFRPAVSAPAKASGAPTLKIPSSWLESVLYKRTPDGASYMVLVLNPETALLYGPKLPSWLPGLVQAGIGGKSVGRAYNKLVKGNYPYQRITGWKEVGELKEMMK